MFSKFRAFVISFLLSRQKHEIYNKETKVVIEGKLSSRVCSIWRKLPSDLLARTQKGIDNACAKLGANRPGYIFFRDDDVAAPGKQFAQLLELFYQLRNPLNLAVVPAWLTRIRWQSIAAPGRSARDLWCWHQHGWRHANHETSGKNQEFGPARSPATLESDIVRGRRRLENMMGNHFFPVFTPPWNRCDIRTLQLLKKHDFVAVSRSQNPKNSILKGLPDFCVNVDLHTRKDRNAVSGWVDFLAELERGVAAGLCGIMLHHSLMNTAAFEYLEFLLKMITARKELHVVHFRDLAQIKKGVRCQVSGFRKE